MEGREEHQRTLLGNLWKPEGRQYIRQYYCINAKHLEYDNCIVIPQESAHVFIWGKVLFDSQTVYKETHRYTKKN